MELAGRVEEACPGLEEGVGIPSGNLITEVVNQVLGTLQAMEGGGIDANVAITRMMLGALSHLADAMPPDRKEVQLYRAGRAIGRFMAAKFEEKLASPGRDA